MTISFIIQILIKFDIITYKSNKLQLEIKMQAVQKTTSTRSMMKKTKSKGAEKKIDQVVNTTNALNKLMKEL